MTGGERITDPDEIKKVLSEMGEHYQANRTSEQAMNDELADYFRDMFQTTVNRLMPEFEADGWTFTSLTYTTTGVCSVEFWRTDLLGAARTGSATR